MNSPPVPNSPHHPLEDIINSTYLDGDAKHGERLQRWVFLGRVAEKLSLSLVPLDGVEHGTFHIVMADQICVITSANGCRHAYADVLHRDHEIWMEKTEEKEETSFGAFSLLIRVQNEGCVN